MKPHWIAAGCVLTLGTGYGAYSWWGTDDHEVPAAVDEDRRSGRRELLALARAKCDAAELDSFIADQRQHIDGVPPGDRGAAWHVLAEALLERVLIANMSKGLVVGQPMYAEVPAQIQGWLDEGLAAIQASRDAGHETSESHRIESALWSNHIVGLGSAFRFNSKVTRALDRAEALDPANPHVQVARGLRALLAPKILGHDPQRALDHLRRGAEGLADDERPRVFCAMAAWLLDQRDDARQWLDQAIELNPKNAYAVAVRRRMDAGEADPFAADLTPDELRAAGG